LKAEIIGKAKSFIENVEQPEDMKMLLKEEDMEGRNCLWYMAMNDIYEILDTTVMDRIIYDLWRSNIDVTGYFMEMSTNFKVVMQTEIGQNKDIERRERFYNWKDTEEIQGRKTHGFQFQVWVQSMRLRYFIESIVFLIFTIFF